MFNVFNLNNHLDSDEKIIIFFRPSRKAYALQYIFWILVLLCAIFFSIYGQPSSNLFILWKFINYASMLILIVTMIMILRIEYRIWSRRYALTSERLIYSNGIFSEIFKSTSYKFITDIQFQQSFWDKVINTGTIMIDTAGANNYEIRYRKISRKY